MRSAQHITRHRVVGHSDIAVRSNSDVTLSTRRIDDPGKNFDWARLERAELVRRRVGGRPPMVYGIGPDDVVSENSKTCPGIALTMPV